MWAVEDNLPPMGNEDDLLCSVFFGLGIAVILTVKWSRDLDDCLRRGDIRFLVVLEALVLT